MSAKALSAVSIALLAVACLSQAQALEASPLGLVHGRSLLQAKNCTLATSALPTTRDANVQAFIAASQGITGFDFFKCAGLQCALYPFLAPALPASPSYDLYLSDYYNACKQKVYDAIVATNLTQAELSAINAAENGCFGNPNQKFEYKSNEDDKKNALSCGGKLQVSSAGLASCGRGLMQLVMALVAILAVKMMM